MPFSRDAFFDVFPCPTTILTIGFLLSRPACPPRVATIPILWAIIGGSAAWVSGVRADAALAAAGAVLAGDLVRRTLSKTIVRLKERSA